MPIVKIPLKSMRFRASASENVGKNSPDQQNFFGTGHRCVFGRVRRRKCRDVYGHVSRTKGGSQRVLKGSPNVFYGTRVRKTQRPTQGFRSDSHRIRLKSSDS